MLYMTYNNYGAGPLWCQLHGSIVQS